MSEPQVWPRRPDCASILPPHIVERFKGKVMAITGYEQDQASLAPSRPSRTANIEQGTITQILSLQEAYVSTST